MEPNNDVHPPDLCCPISLELLEDPVTTPCCGRTFSRAPLSQYLAGNTACPLCRARIKKKFPHWDVGEVPPNRNIIAMIEHYQLSKKASAEGKSVPRLVLDDDPVWNCVIRPVNDSLGEELPVSGLSLNVNWPTYDGDVCMFIPVIDKSGSMSGKPFDQVKQALLHMHYLTFTNRHVFSCMILYDSKAEKIMVPRDGDLTTARAKAVEDRIKTMSATGGTNFSAAFKMIQEVLLGTKDAQGNWSQGAPVTVTSAVVVFMTDGQDNTYYGKSDGAETLVNLFKSNLKDWKKPLTVHTIGFSQDHDFGFLDKLRKVGSIEGVFRYADPQDDGDSLCQKMSDLATSIISNTALQATIYTPFPLRGGAKHSECVPPTSRYRDDPLKKYKTDLSFDMDDGHGRLDLFLDAEATEVKEKLESFIIEIGRRDFEFKIDYEMESEGRDLAQKWMTHLARNILSRTVILANASNKTSISFRLQCSLLLKQGRSIAVYIRSDPSLLNQLQMCIEQLENLLRGKQASIARLNDVAQSSNIKAATPAPTTSTTSTPIVAHPLPAIAHKAGPAILNDMRAYVRTCTAGRSKLHAAVLNGTTAGVQQLVIQEPALCIAVDQDGNTPLMYAACIGRQNVIELLFNTESREKCNKLKFAPLDMAAVCGKWKTCDILLNLGAKLNPETNGYQLLKDLLSYRYYNTAGRLIANGLVTLSDEILRQSLPASTLEWVMEKMAEKDMTGSAKPQPVATATTTTTLVEEPKDEKSEQEKATLYLRNAVENGMLNLVKKLLISSVNVTLDLIFLCGPKGETGADIAELLLAKSPINVDEDDGSLGLKPDESFETPLFRASEKGWDQLLIVLINHGANANWQNQAGNTPLWIACMNRHLECIVELLNAGANPNLPNNKGDVPLMCACQRNMCSGVAALTAVGAQIYQTDPKVNSPVMVCCRLGHDVILETLLSKLTQEPQGEEKVRDQLNLFATIDGFNPLIAAAEQNKSPCIKVLASYKADLEAKTSDDNKILPQATALHVAVFYGCVEAALTLLELGASPNCLDLSGRTPMHLAVLQSNAMMVRLLKSFKADMSIRDGLGRIASFYASSAEIKFELDDPSLKYLLQLAQSGSLEPNLRNILARDAGLPGVLKASECVDIASGDGWTPLMESLVFGNSEFAQLLIELGADPNRTDVNGLSASFWAYMLHRDHTVFFGKDVALSPSEATAISTIETLKIADVRNALLFDIDLSALRQETNADNTDQPDSFLHLSMLNRIEKWDSSDAIEIPNTRSKCSVGSFLKAGVNDKSLWIGDKKICPNILLLNGLASAAKYLVSAPAEGENSVGLQELAALHLISSNYSVFSSLNAGLAVAHKTWAPFATLAIHALEMLPTFPGEVYRGVSMKFQPESFAVGKKVTWSSFTMCTSSWYELLNKDSQQAGNPFKYNVMFLIKTTNAKSVSAFSGCSNFAPVVLLPNSTFVIKSLHVADPIGLGQPDCRNSAYKMTESYLLQAEKKGRPVFVVLEEERT